MFVRQSRIKYVQDTITTRFLVLKWVGRDSFRHNVRIILQLHGKSTDNSRCFSLPIMLEIMRA